MDERVRFVGDVVRGFFPFSELCRPEPTENGD